MTVSPPYAAAVPAGFGPRWQALMVLLFNTLVGAVLAFASGEPATVAAFARQILYAQSVGFTIFAAIYFSAWLGKSAACPLPRDLAIGVLMGALLGNLLGSLLTGTLDRDPAAWGGKVFIALTFGGLVAHFLFTTVRIAQGQVELRVQEMRRVTAEAQLMETRLRLLQAQIEPHFLFNTLSNIHGLIETDPPRAARMLESLTRLLRASLKRTRDGATTLGDELALVRAYLAIQQERMGDRLHYEIDAPEALLGVALPPLLIQPLVENAVQHGIEPATEGGRVTVRVRDDAERLQIEVNDTGNGLGGGAEGHGLGLANVAERLSVLYGTQAALQVSAAPRGVHATMVVPVAERNDVA